VEKYRRAGMVTGDDMARVHCILATNPLKISNTYCFSTATMVPRTRLNFTFYLHRRSCYSYLCISYLFIHAELGWHRFIDWTDWLDWL